MPSRLNAQWPRASAVEITTPPGLDQRSARTQCARNRNLLHASTVRTVAAETGTAWRIRSENDLLFTMKYPTVWRILGTHERDLWNANARSDVTGPRIRSHEKIALSKYRS